MQPVKKCHRCGTAFVKQREYDSILLHRYVLTINEHHIWDEFQQVSAVFCKKCADKLFLFLRDEGYLKEAPEVTQE